MTWHAAIPSGGRPQMANQRGWTLIELAAVLTVIGLMTSLAQPSLDGLTSRWLLRSASATLIQAMRTARHRAMTEGRAYTVVFDAVNHRYQIIGGPAPNIVDLPAGVRFGAAGVLGPPSNPTKPPPATGVTFRQATVTFRPDGTLSPGPGTIYLTGRDGRVDGTGRNGVVSPAMAISVSISGHLRRYLWENRQWRAL